MDYLPLFVAGVEIVVLMGLFFYAASQQWGHTTVPDSDCISPTEVCYCEKEGGRWNVRQRSNTWSNVVITAVGALHLAALTFASPATPQNPMQSATIYSVFFGMLVIFLGPGSMFFHASLKRWGGWVDTMSMNLFISFIVVYTLARLFVAGETASLLFVVGLYLLINVTVGIVVWRNESAGTKFFAGLVAVTILIELGVLIAPQFTTLRIQREAGWLFVGLAIFAVSYIVWKASDTNGPLCRDGNVFGWFSPTSWVQGHAVWHILNAAAVTAIFFYLRTEMLV